MPAERKRLIYYVAKRDRRRGFSDAVWALDGKDREENNPPEGHTSGAPPSNIEMHEADLYLERKMPERQMKDESQNSLWECEIHGRRVRSRTTAEASSSDSCPHQMGRPNPGANISIGNPRRIAARRKRQTEAPDHKMQDNKGQANQALARKKKRIKWRHGEEKRDFRACKLQATTVEKPLRASL